MNSLESDLCVELKFHSGSSAPCLTVNENVWEKGKAEAGPGALWRDQQCLAHFVQTIWSLEFMVVSSFNLD